MPFRDEREATEWAQWRGGVDQQLKNNADTMANAISDLSKQLLARMDQQDREFVRRMDTQDRTIKELLTEARTTNGRVTRLEADHEAADEIDHKLQQRDDEHERHAGLRIAKWQIVIAGLSILVSFLIGIASLIVQLAASH